MRSDRNYAERHAAEALAAKRTDRATVWFVAVMAVVAYVVHYAFFKYEIVPAWLSYAVAAASIPATILFRSRAYVCFLSRALRR